MVCVNVVSRFMNKPIKAYIHALNKCLSKTLEKHQWIKKHVGFLKTIRLIFSVSLGSYKSIGYGWR